MRLIDADSLVLNGWFLVRVNNDGCSVGFEIQHLNVTPTAYDIDRVVELLERAKDEFSGGTLQEQYYWKGIETAIEIVKGGAV